MPHHHPENSVRTPDEAIRRSGLRRTVPRAVVARALQATAGHHSVGDLQALTGATLTLDADCKALSAPAF